MNDQASDRVDSHRANGGRRVDAALCRARAARGDEALARVGPGETFGEMAIIDNAPRSLSAVAVEPSEIAVISQRMFLFLVHETPMFAIQVMQSLASRIRELDDRI